MKNECVQREPVLIRKSAVGGRNMDITRIVLWDRIGKTGVMVGETDIGGNRAFQGSRQIVALQVYFLDTTFIRVGGMRKFFCKLVAG